MDDVRLDRVDSAALARALFDFAILRAFTCFVRNPSARERAPYIFTCSTHVFIIRCYSYKLDPIPLQNRLGPTHSRSFKMLRLGLENE